MSNTTRKYYDALGWPSGAGASPMGEETKLDILKRVQKRPGMITYVDTACAAMEEYAAQEKRKEAIAYHRWLMTNCPWEVYTEHISKEDYDGLYNIYFEQSKTNTDGQ